MQYYERMAWIVELLDDRVRDELEILPLDMQAHFRRIVELIQGYGLERVREPHVKHLEGSLWEMRMKGKDGISRAIYREFPRPALPIPCKVLIERELTRLAVYIRKY